MDSKPSKIGGSPTVRDTEGDSSDDSSHQLWLKDRLHTLRFSVTYRIFWGILIALSIFILIWTIIYAKDTPPVWLIVLDGFVTLCFTIEVALRVVAYRKAYFRNLFRVLEFVLVILCIALFIFYVATSRLTTQYSQWGAALEISLLTLRYFLQVCRVILMFKMTRTFVVHQPTFASLAGYDVIDYDAITVPLLASAPESDVPLSLDEVESAHSQFTLPPASPAIVDHTEAEVCNV